MHVHVHIYMYIYIYVYIHAHTRTYAGWNTRLHRAVPDLDWLKTHQKGIYILTYMHACIHRPVEYVATEDLRPLDNPDHEWKELLSRLTSCDWAAQLEALNTTRALSIYHASATVLQQLHPLVRAVLQVSLCAFVCMCVCMYASNECNCAATAASASCR